MSGSMGLPMIIDAKQLSALGSRVENMLLKKLTKVFIGRCVIVGSSHLAFTEPELYCTCRNMLNDIDILVQDEDHIREQLMSYLENLYEIDGFRIYDYKQMPDGKILSVWRLPIEIMNEVKTIQIDFLPANLKTARDFARFAHSSDVDDFAAGLKGFHHKYLMQSLNAKPSDWDNKVITAAGNPSSKEVLSLKAFSVKLGMREKYRPSEEVGTVVEIPKKAYKYITNLESIAEIEFGSRLLAPEMGSFLGILRIMARDPDRFPVSRITTIFDYYVQMLFGKDAQRIDADDDDMIKNAGVIRFQRAFTCLADKDITPIMDSYYEDDKSK